MDVTKRHADGWPYETWTRMFIAAQFPRAQEEKQFPTAQEEKQPKGPSVNGCIHKMWQSPHGASFGNRKGMASQHLLPHGWTLKTRH